MKYNIYKIDIKKLENLKKELKGKGLIEQKTISNSTIKSTFYISKNEKKKYGGGSHIKIIY